MLRGARFGRDDAPCPSKMQRVSDLREYLLQEGSWVEIAGESHYQDALIRLAAGTSPGEPVRCVATLVPEPESPFDPRAIAVRIDGLHVGYLTRADARRWGPALAVLARRGLQPQVRARIVGGRIRNGSREMLGVRISGALPEVET